MLTGPLVQTKVDYNEMGPALVRQLGNPAEVRLSHFLFESLLI